MSAEHTVSFIGHCFPDIMLEGWEAALGPRESGVEQVEMSHVLETLAARYASGPGGGLL